MTGSADRILLQDPLGGSSYRILWDWEDPLTGSSGTGRILLQDPLGLGGSSDRILVQNSLSKRILRLEVSHSKDPQEKL
jgi:hypothetical protein